MKSVGAAPEMMNGPEPDRISVAAAAIAQIDDPFGCHCSRALIGPPKKRDFDLDQKFRQ
jgi:hypothetical protein